MMKAGGGAFQALCLTKVGSGLKGLMGNAGSVAQLQIWSQGVVRRGDKMAPGQRTWSLVFEQLGVSAW